MTKTKTLYLRNQRVGSSRFMGTLIKNFTACERIVKHCYYEEAKRIYESRLTENPKQTKWKDLHLICSVRNPWEQHISIFFRKRGIGLMRTLDGDFDLSNKKNGLSAQFFNQNKKIQNLIIDNFKQTVSEQYDHFKNFKSKKTNQTIDQAISSGDTPATSAFQFCYINWPIYTLNNEIMTSLCIKTDGPNIKQDIQTYVKLSGLDENSKYVQKYMNRYISYACSRTDNKRDHHKFYDKEAREKVAEMRAMEINAHKYKF